MTVLDPHPKSHFSPRLAFGLGLMFLGGLLLLQRFGLLEWHHLAWWPVLLLLLGLAMLWKRGFAQSFGGHVLLMLGLVGLAGEFGREDLVERFWPGAIVWIGLVLVIRALMPLPRPCCPGDAPPQAPPTDPLHPESGSPS